MRDPPNTDPVIASIYSIGHMLDFFEDETGSKLLPSISARSPKLEAVKLVVNPTTTLDIERGGRASTARSPPPLP
jgi:hypothetical protein